MHAAPGRPASAASRPAGIAARAASSTRSSIGPAGGGVGGLVLAVGRAAAVLGRRLFGSVRPRARRRLVAFGWAGGSRVARGPAPGARRAPHRRRRPASRPSSAAAARAARSASSGARRPTPTPSASAAAHSASRISWLAVDARQGRARRVDVLRRHSVSSSGALAAARRASAGRRWKASRSASAAGTRSSRSMPSSSATTPKRASRRSARPSRSSATSPVSSTAASSRCRGGPTDARPSPAAAAPPSASASRPRCATGRPACSVAARSSPPSRRSSLMCSGRRARRARRQQLRSSASQRSRTGPAGDAQHHAAEADRVDGQQRRSAGGVGPGVRAQACGVFVGFGLGQHALFALASSTCCAAPTTAGRRDPGHRPGGRERPAPVMPRTVPPRRGRRARWSRRRRADCGAAGGAAPAGRCACRWASPTARVAVQRGQRTGGAHQRELAAQAVGAERHAQPRGAFERGIGHLRVGQPRTRGHDAPARALVLLLPLGGEGLGVALEGIAAAHDLDARGQVGRASSPRPTGRSGRAIAGAVRPPPGCRCRPARSAPDAAPTGPRARPRSRPRRPRRAAGRPGDPRAG